MSSFSIWQAVGINFQGMMFVSDVRRLRKSDGSLISVPRINAALAICAFATFWLRTSQTILPANWQGDFQYFWQAGRTWLDAKSPYGAAYLEQGASMFVGFANPFFYPPNAPPVFAFLALMPPPYAAAFLYCANACAIIAIAALTSRMAKHFGSVVPQIYIFTILIIFFAIFMRPFIRVAIIGQPTILLALGFVAFLFGQLKRQPLLMSVGLTTLLLKPHFGVPIAIYALAKKETRIPTLYAIVATAILAAAGLGFESPLETVRLFLSNVSAYSTLPENGAIKMGGLSTLAAHYSFDMPIAAKLAIASLAAISLSRVAHSPISECSGACAVIAVAFFVFPSHSTDFVLLAPAAIFIFTPMSLAARTVLFVLLSMLGRSWNTAQVITPANIDHAATVGALHTFIFAGMALVLIVLTVRYGSISGHVVRAQSIEQN